MSIEEEFSSAVRNSRSKSGYTQTQVAEMLSVTTRWYQKIEQGNEFPGGLLMLKLLKLLQIDVNQFRSLPSLDDPNSEH